LKDLYDYFSGHIVRVQRDGYEESITIPRAERSVVGAAIQATVKERRLWLISGRGSFFAEDLPAGVLSDEAYLQGPPQPIPARDVLPQTLPEAWGGETTTALEIANALSTKVGKMLPWVTVHGPATMLVPGWSRYACRENRRYSMHQSLRLNHRCMMAGH
jgi:hypothetical protein